MNHTPPHLSEPRVTQLRGVLAGWVCLLLGCGIVLGCGAVLKTVALMGEGGGGGIL